MEITAEIEKMTTYSVSESEKPFSVEDTISENLELGVNTILYGPPGTGKTYTVLDIISKKKLNQEIGEVLVIQFHPQYSYQDFIEGYKFDGNGFVYKEGIFLDFCTRIDKNKINILYINEINRADLSSVFGELLYLLDKDDEKSVNLPLKGTSFSLPKNLVIIGSMNSSDKSISLIDFALRRRFDFIFVPPSLDGFNEIISRRQVSDDFDIAKYSKFFQVINTRILKHPLLGKNMTLGHSMFFDKSGTISNKSTYKALTSVVIPQIEAYFGAENYSEIAQLLSPEIAQKLTYGKRFSLEEIIRLVDIVASSEEEVEF